MYIDDEIDELESKKADIEIMIMELEESEENKEDEINELSFQISVIEDELEELYSIRNDNWGKERKQEFDEYWSMVL